MADDRRQPHQGPPSCSRRKRGNQDLARTKGGLNTKLHLAVDAHGLPVKMIVTKGTTADCSQAEALIDGLLAEHVLADKAYDTNALLKYLTDRKMNPVIPPSRRRKTLRAYDRDIYRHRHLVENAFLTRISQSKGCIGPRNLGN